MKCYEKQKSSILDSKDSCDVEVMYNIIDKFGLNVNTQEIDEKQFKAFVSVDVSPTFFGWVLGFGGKIKITGPDNVLEDFRTTLSNVLI